MICIIEWDGIQALSTQLYEAEWQIKIYMISYDGKWKLQ